MRIIIVAKAEETEMTSEVAISLPEVDVDLAVTVAVEEAIVAVEAVEEVATSNSLT